MAIIRTRITDAKNTKEAKNREDQTERSAARPQSFFRNETTQFMLGLVVLGFAAYLMVAFFSFISTGGADQSVLENATIGELVSSEHLTDNAAGKQGARLADFLVNRAFGVASVFIIVFLVALGVKLVRAARVCLWKWFVCCTLLMVWFSVLLGFSLRGVYENSYLYLGGTHGYNIGYWMEAQIGVSGVWLLLILTLLCVLVYVRVRTIPLLRKVLSFGYVRPKRKADPEEGQVPEDFNRSWTGEPSRAGQGKKVAAAAGDAGAQAEKTEQEEERRDGEEPSAGDDEAREAATPAGDGGSGVSFQDGGVEMEVVVAGPGEESAADPEPEDGEDGKDAPDFVVETTEDEEYQGPAQEPYNPRLDLENYKLPGVGLMRHFEDDTPILNMEEQSANRDRIVETLRSFGIEISSIKGTVGPTVTLYEITPAQGVRISKIRNLEDDIALSLSALGIRIIAPIPGKGTIGIEVPNKDPKIVSGQSIIGSKKFQESKFDLPLALGKTISNEVFMVDLCKMPHILVAGATGQGKSVGLNAMITSLLYRKHPSELKMVLIDPKKVEFSIYADLEHHFLAELPDSAEPVVTDVKKVVKTLTSLCSEMDTRYNLLKAAHVRNVKEYNEKFIQRRLNPLKGHRYLPYIVVIIDEFGDLIMTAGKDVELPIARIAQLARAVGIHMIIATQRPTTNIITGTIKANFPARVAFKVTSMIDSRTILDRPGANQLIGKGDMLFLAGNDPVRVQCAFIDTPEVESITAHIAKQQGYPTPFYLPEVAEEGDAADAADVDLNNLDPLFEEVARLIVVNQQGSTSLIQRKFAIGFNRAGRLMDQLEKAGVVGPSQGSKAREVLCMDEMELESKIRGLL